MILAHLFWKIPTNLRILEHLGGDAEAVDPAHPSRAPSQGDLSL